MLAAHHREDAMTHPTPREQDELTDELRAGLEGRCSLSAEALRERIALLRREVWPHVVATASGDRSFHWEFTETPAMRDTLERLVALERECCGGGIGWELGSDAGAGRLRLTITGIEPESELFRSFRVPVADAVDATRARA
jgi:hypothetical protein